MKEINYMDEGKKQCALMMETEADIEEACARLGRKWGNGDREYMIGRIKKNGNCMVAIPWDWYNDRHVLNTDYVDTVEVLDDVRPIFMLDPRGGVDGA